MKYVVFHRSYGCDTGCCGHTVVSVPDEVAADPEWDCWDAEDATGLESNHNFDFTHPWNEDFKAWAEQFVRDTYGAEHVADLDWEHSLVIDD
jgi:hypothetical protein